MRKKVMRIVREKRGLFSLFVLSGLLITVFYTQSLVTKIKNLSILSDGVQTCFTRVGQSYTSKMLNEASFYVTPGFMSATEECFGDSLAMVNDYFGDVSIGPAKKLNLLASDVHWFHEKVGSHETVSKENSAFLLNFNSRFEKIEKLYDEMTGNNDLLRTNYAENVATARMVSILFSLVLVFFILWEYLAGGKRRANNIQFEKRAVSELGNDSHIVTGSALESIITGVLEQNGLVNCSRLFANYQSDILDGNISAYVSKSYVESTEYLSPREVVGKEVIEDEESVHLDEVLARVIDVFASKLFTKGVVLDLNVEEDVFVHAKQEELEQVLYQVINNSIESGSEMDSKRILIGLKKLGGVVLFDIEHSGEGFPDDVVKNGAFADDLVFRFSTGFSICREFMGEFRGQVSLENVTDNLNDIVGGRIKLVFRAGHPVPISEQETPKLVSLKKGKKKQLLTEMEKAL